ncbi:MAG: acyl-CoA dehydrogenase family protein [Actinomycetota bacterium]|nr:acyl-CoA dehydrogenase family protein [Actinomycetota bacterium]
MSVDTVEDLDSFRRRARDWIRANLKPLDHAALAAAMAGEPSEEQELAQIQHERHLMRMMFDGGFAGITIAPEYGGQGLTPAHQRAFNEELSGFEHPSHLMVPNVSPCAAVLLDFGTEEQKKTHIPAILKGEELWMQLLSEPSGGSDVAGALTTAVRDGDEWVLNGSKIWTTGAWWSDWGLCLARTNWDVPKHRGLTVFIFPLHREGVDVHRIEMLNGSKEFCQEFLTDVRVPDTDRVGEVDKGWTVGTRWMFHERMLYNSPLITMPAFGRPITSSVSPIDVARDAGRLDDPLVRDLIGESRMLETVGARLQQRVGQGVRTGRLSDQGAAISRLFIGVAGARSRTITFQIAGSAGGAWSDSDGAVAGQGTGYLMRQTGCIGGGTTEMARNVISERVLGMPRERSVDRDVPFREVPRGPSADTRSRS